MKFWHNGILTVDLEKTIEFLGAAGGMPREKWTIMEAEFRQANMLAGDGGKLRIAFGRVGGIVTELLQPQDATSYHAKALKARGPGYQHCAYICEDDQEEVISELQKTGGRIVWDFKNGNERACYVESADGSAVLEIINHCPFMPEE